MFGTTTTLPGSDCPSNLDARARRKLVREVTKRPVATLDLLMAKSGHSMHVATISQVLQKCGLYERTARKKSALKKRPL